MNNVASDITTIGTLAPGYSLGRLENLLERAAPGDYVQVKRNSSGSPHSMIVVSVNAASNMVELFDANSDGKGTVKHYSQSFSYFQQRNAGVSVYRYSGYTPVRGHNPQGCVDTVEDAVNAIHVRGWAFDKDNISQSIDVHVYIGGPAGVGEGHIIQADALRGDVNTAHGVGDYHGFDTVIPTDLTGTKQVYIYAINTGEGENTLIGNSSVVISNDNVNPVVSDVVVTSVTNSSYTVFCKVTDNKGVNRVLFPSWNKLKPEMTKWYEGTIHPDGAASCIIPVNELSGLSGTYITHIYAYDRVGNCGTGATSIQVDTTPITERTVVDLGDDFEGYIYNKANKKVLTVDAGDNVVSRTDEGIGAQRWKFGRNADGSYRIISKANDKCLNGEDAAAGASDANVIVKDFTDNNNQKWFIIKGKDEDYYHLRPACSDSFVIDLAGNNSNDNTNIQLYGFHGLDSQRFMIQKDTVNVEEIQLNTTKLQFADIGESSTLRAEIIPANSSNKTVMWSSVDENVAVVDSDGTVTAVNEGNTTIIATTEDGNKTASCEVSVNIPSRVTEIKLNKTELIFNELWLSDRLAAVIVPENAEEQDIIWESSDPSVAIVDESGMVISVGNGTAVITVQTDDGSKTDSCSVHVDAGENIAVTGISFDKDRISFSNAGESETLTANITPLDASNKSVIWKSSDVETVSVNDIGEVIALNPGTAIVTATTEDGNKIAVCVVEVRSESICEHEYDYVVLEEPSCNREGTAQYICAKCDDSHMISLPCYAHTWNQWEVSVQAACTVSGHLKHSCGICGASETREIPAQGHLNTEIRNEKAATCAEDGYTGDVYCRSCRTNVSLGTVIAKTEIHEWDDGVVTKEASETEKGIKTYTCSVCDAVRTEDIPATGEPNPPNIDPEIPQTPPADKKAQYPDVNTGELHLYEKGQAFVLKVSDAEGEITYESSAPKVAKVNRKGKVTPLSSGKAVITIEAAGNSQYEKAVISVDVVVYSKIAAVKNVKAVSTKTKRTLKVSWKKMSAASYYQVQYAYTKNMKNARTLKSKTPLMTIKKLKSKKYVYVRIRACGVKGGVTSYGKWSKVVKSKGKIR